MRTAVTIYARMGKATSGAFCHRFRARGRAVKRSRRSRRATARSPRARKRHISTSPGAHAKISAYCAASLRAAGLSMSKGRGGAGGMLEL